MADEFEHFIDAARALLELDTLSEKEGQFCGGLCYRRYPVTERQAWWLRLLLKRHGLPDLAEGAEHG